MNTSSTIEVDGGDVAALTPVIQGRSDEEILALRERSSHTFEGLLDELVQHMVGMFDPNAAGDARAAIRYDLSLPSGTRSYTVRVQDGTCSAGIEPGDAEADVRISMSAADFVRMSCGELNVAKAFLKRRMKLKGDLKIARQSGTWFTDER